ncbi:MAG TPA: hypothetical protein VIT41_03620 [Microlunatus sp.]
MRPSTVQVDGDELLVGGSTGDDAARSPALVRRSTAEPASVWRTVPLTPATPYGERAALVSVTGDGGSIVALGMAHGGAHANFRWTIWTGTSAGVVDRPQTFETFGGQEAGGLLAVAHDDRGPLIVGTWQGAHGLDGAIWRTQSERWVRQPTPASLVSTVDRQTAPRTAATQADGSVAISGSVIDLADGVRQSAAVWRGSGVDWRLSLPADPGKRSEAWSTVCEGSGPPGCWSVGSREGAVAVWSDDGRSSLPELRVGDDDAGVIARHGDRVVAAISTHGQGRLLVGHDGAWRLYTGPDGVVRAAALVGSRLYLISEREDSAVLSTRDLGDLLVG